MLALVSDAGTPLLSDPGFVLVRAAAAAGIEVRTIAGSVGGDRGARAWPACPPIASCSRGFCLHRARRASRSALLRLSLEPRTIVLFEAPHRIAAALTELAAAFGAQREAVGDCARADEDSRNRVSRHAGVSGSSAPAADADMARGEITLVIAGNPRCGRGRRGTARPASCRCCSRTCRQRALRQWAAQISGVPRRVAYEQAMQLGAAREP